LNYVCIIKLVPIRIPNNEYSFITDKNFKTMKDPNLITNDVAAITVTSEADVS